MKLNKNYVLVTVKVHPLEVVHEDLRGKDDWILEQMVRLSELGHNPAYAALGIAKILCFAYEDTLLAYHLAGIPDEGYVQLQRDKINEFAKKAESCCPFPLHGGFRIGVELEPAVTAGESVLHYTITFASTENN